MAQGDFFDVGSPAELINFQIERNISNLFKGFFALILFNRPQGSSDNGKACVQLTLRYSSQRRKMVVVVHKVM